jgi:hypothetical protein
VEGFGAELKPSDLVEAEQYYIMQSDDNKVEKCFDISDKRNTGVMWILLKSVTYGNWDIEMS